jgi:hypothetical protein
VHNKAVQLEISMAKNGMLQKNWSLCRYSSTFPGRCGLHISFLNSGQKISPRIVFKLMGCRIHNRFILRYGYVPTGFFDCFKYCHFLFTQFCLSVVIVTKKFMSIYKCMYVN